ncbi:MAG: TadE/TadG family type IV pilus assembly protein [Kineosporiaceae bacterium]
MPRPARDGGFTSVVLLVAVVPVMLLVFVTCVDLGLAAYAWGRADIAAREGAAAVGISPESAAGASLSTGLLRDARVEVEDDEIIVSVAPASLVGVGRAIGRIEASAELPAEGAP